MDTLIAGLVIDSKRMDMMPKYFGRWMMKTEGNIYGWMKEMAICNLWLEHSDFQSKSPASAFSIKVGM